MSVSVPETWAGHKWAAQVMFISRGHATISRGLCQLWPIRGQYGLILTNQRPVSPVYSRQTFPFLWPNDRGNTHTRQNIQMSDWLPGSNRNIIETPVKYLIFDFVALFYWNMIFLVNWWLKKINKKKYFRLCLSFEVSWETWDQPPSKVIRVEKEPTRGCQGVSHLIPLTKLCFFSYIVFLRPGLRVAFKCLNVKFSVTALAGGI